MNNNLSKRIQNIDPSITLDITAKAKELRDSGINVINFGAGEPDFDTPKNIKEKAIEVINKGNIKYTATSGIVELKKAICNKFQEDNNITYNLDNIIVSNGAKQSIYNTCLAILNEGDEIILSAPYWVSYPEIIKLTGGVPVYVETSEENEFKYNIDDISKSITSKTKAIILNTPNNPTGSVYTRSELEKIADIAVKNNLFVISDEIYEKLVYEGEHISIASLNDDIKNLTITINGMSKAYAMTGWRLGYAAANVEIVKLMSNIQSHTTSNTNSIAQYASVEGLEGDQTDINTMKNEFMKRRDYMYKKINEMKEVYCIKPKGAFYIMLNIKNVINRTIKNEKIENSLDFARLLLENENVAVVPGIAFGSDSYIRLSYATSYENIIEGLSRIESFINSLDKKS